MFISQTHFPFEYIFLSSHIIVDPISINVETIFEIVVDIYGRVVIISGIVVIIIIGIVVGIFVDISV